MRIYKVLSKQHAKESVDVVGDYDVLYIKEKRKKRKEKEIRARNESEKLDPIQFDSCAQSQNSVRFDSIRFAACFSAKRHLLMVLLEQPLENLKQFLW